MNNKLITILRRRRRQRLLYTLISLAIYFSGTLQWATDLGDQIVAAEVSRYLPIAIFFTLIITMCVLEWIQFYLADHRYQPDVENIGLAECDSDSDSQSR